MYSDAPKPQRPGLHVKPIVRNNNGHGILQDSVKIDDITQFYTLQRRLGEGATAQVYLGKRKSDGKEHALKATAATSLQPYLN